MNKAFMDQITNMLGTAQSAATSIGLAVKAEVPELCRQIIAWELWSNVAYGLVWLCVEAALVVAAVKTARWLQADKPELKRGSDAAEWRSIREVASAFFIVGVALFAVPTVFCLHDAMSAIIKCLTAPDLVILDYVKAAIAAVK